MKKKQHALVKVEQEEQPTPELSQAFLQNFQTALLLSLLDKNLLTQWQYEQCVEKLHTTKL